MKQVGILTLHYGLNYGGVLQTYATKEILSSLGYSPIIIDRIPAIFGKSYPFKRAFIHPFTQHAFFAFRKNELRPISKPIFSPSELSTFITDSKLYGIVVGSDQVWRKGVFSVEGDYFLIKEQNIPIKKIAFAASMGIGKWEYNEEETQEITSSLKRFDGISVRETESVGLLKSNCDMDATNVADPTIIANPSIYDKLIGKSKTNCKGKLVTYILDWSDTKKEVINSISKSLNLEVHDILKRDYTKRSTIKRIISPSPSVYDWVGSIKSADYVITDSFHGTAFSLIFNKQFTTIGNPERGMARFNSLLGQVGLTNRITTGKETIETNDIDYSIVNHSIDDLRKTGINFLKAHL